MSNIKILTMVRLTSLFGLNKARYSTNPRVKRRTYLTFLILVFIVFLLGCFIYNQLIQISALVPTSVWIGFPSLVYLGSFLFVLFDCVMRGTSLFKAKDLPQLLSMPVTRTQLIVSQILFYYLWEMIVTCVIHLPLLFLFLSRGIVSPVQIPLLLLGILLIPVLPIGLGLLIGVIITFLTRRLPFRSALTALTQLLVFGLIFLVTQKLSGSSGGISSAQVLSLTDAIGGRFPVAAWYGSGFFSLHLPSLLLFLGVNLGVFALSVALLVRLHPFIIETVQTGHSKRVAPASTILRSPERALLYRECKLIFSNFLYPLNTLIGGLFCPVLAIFAVVNQAQIHSAFALLGWESALPMIAAIAAAACSNMASLTASSLSAEGKTLGLLKSLPIDFQTILRVKRKTQYLLYLPFPFVAYLIVALFFGFSLIFTLLGALFIFLYSVTAAAIGQIANLSFPNTDWQNLMEIVKQGAAVIISLVANIVFALCSLFLIIGLPTGSFLLNGLVLIVVFLFLAAVSLRWIQRKGRQLLQNLR